MKKTLGNQNDVYLGSPMEIINIKSRYNGYYGYVGDKYYGDNKYKLYIKPKYEHEGDNWILVYVDYYKIHNWVRIVPEELLYQ